MDPTQHWCPNMVCADFLKVAAGNIKVYSYSERRYYCTTCRQTFSADAGTFFETLRSERHQVVDVLVMLMERNSLRALERLRHHSHNAILHWVDLAGQHTAAVSAGFRLQLGHGPSSGICPNCISFQWLLSQACKFDMIAGLFRIFGFAAPWCTRSIAPI